jgi:hypothetical protein
MIGNVSCDNVRTSTHLHNLSDDEGMALRLGRKAQKVLNVASRVQVDGEHGSTAQLASRVRKVQTQMVISPANVSYLH